jgi:hypothetical protein
MQLESSSKLSGAEKMSRQLTETQSNAKTERLLADLANLEEDRMERFRQRWDVFYSRYTDEELLTRRDELRMLWTRRFFRLPADCSDAEFENATGLYLSRRTVQIYENWRASPPEPLEQFICDHWLRLDKSPFLVVWSSKEKRLKPNPRCLPSVLAVATLLHAAKLRVCRNLDCPGRYFLGVRSDQKYCSTDCALPAVRAAKRKWWNKEHGLIASRSKPS